MFRVISRKWLELALSKAHVTDAILSHSEKLRPTNIWSEFFSVSFTTDSSYHLQTNHLQFDICSKKSFSNEFSPEMFIFFNLKEMFFMQKFIWNGNSRSTCMYWLFSCNCVFFKKIRIMKSIKASSRSKHQSSVQLIHYNDKKNSCIIYKERTKKYYCVIPSHSSVYVLTTNQLQCTVT